MVRLTVAMYQPISFIGLVKGLQRLSFSPACPSTQVPPYSVAFFPHGKTMAMLNKL